MKLERNNAFYNTVNFFVNACLLAKYDISLEGAEHIPKKGPALVLAKHQNTWDAPLENHFNRKAGRRYSNYVMKNSLPAIFKYGGGIPIKRDSDLCDELRILTGEKKAEIESLEKKHDPKGIRYEMELGQIRERYEKLKAQARKDLNDFNDRSFESIGFLLLSDELVIVHPEGSRKPNGRRPSEKIVDYIKRVAKDSEIPIPVIPMGLEYGPKRSLRQKVTVRAGEELPIDHPNLMRIVTKEMATLSGLQM